MGTSSRMLAFALYLVGSAHTFGCPIPEGCPENTEEFLSTYGYLNSRATNECSVGDIRAALIKFQQFHAGAPDVAVTGECDNATLALLKKPRCGCKDVVVRELNPKWSITNLTWTVSKYPNINHHLSYAEVDDAMRRGLDIWAQQTPLTFHKVTAHADIDIRFEFRRHTLTGPFYDFDGRGGAFAHAFLPPSGVVHFDDEETFVLNSGQGIDLFIAAAHVFGHALGLVHSNVHGALMTPEYRHAEKLVLHNDDIEAIKTLYPADTHAEAITTHAPTEPALTTPTSDTPSYCNMPIQAAIRIDGMHLVFANDPDQPRKTVVYKVDQNGLDPNSKVSLSRLFKMRSAKRHWLHVTARPKRVDAAAYISSTRQIFLFRGDRVYRYTIANINGPYYLDESDGYPKCIDVSNFPERPRAAVAMSTRKDQNYVQFLGKTRIWDWNVDTQQMGDAEYPISFLGEKMPSNVQAAFLERSGYNPVFIQKDQDFRLNPRSDGTVVSLKREFFKGLCM